MEVPAVTVEPVASVDEQVSNSGTSLLLGEQQLDEQTTSLQGVKSKSLKYEPPDYSEKEKVTPNMSPKYEHVIRAEHLITHYFLSLGVWLQSLHNEVCPTFITLQAPAHSAFRSLTRW